MGYTMPKFYSSANVRLQLGLHIVNFFFFLNFHLIYNHL